MLPLGRRGLAALVAAFVLIGQLPGPVAADHGGRPIGSLFNCQRPGVDPPRCTSVGNNGRHFVFIDPSVPDELAASLRDAIAEDYDATNLVARVQTAITAATDVIVYAADYGANGAAGWVYCPPDSPQGTNADGHRWCQRQELHLNLNPRYAVFFADDASRDHVACHELGHTLGLRHWGNPPESEGPAAATCMTSNTPNGTANLHQIDIDHLNAYPAYRRPSLSRPARAFVVA